MALSPRMRDIVDGVLVAIKGYVGRELSPLELIQRDLIGRLDKAAVALDSAERRLSRHAEHLAKLESRLQAVEHSKGTR